MKLRTMMIGLAMLMPIAACGDDETHVIACNAPAPEAEGFGEFITKFTQAVKDHDVEGIASVIDTNIKSTFGPDNGKEMFLTRYSLISSPEESGFWKKMDTILNLGIDATNTNAEMVVYPCTFADLPKTDWIALHHSASVPFGYKVVTAKDAVLTDMQGKTLRVLEPFETLLLQEDRVKTHDGLVGIVDQHAVRSPLDHRAIFTRTEGTWKMTAFVAGD